MYYGSRASSCGSRHRLELEARKQVVLLELDWKSFRSHTLLRGPGASVCISHRGSHAIFPACRTAFANTNRLLYVLKFVAIVPMTVPSKATKSACFAAAVCTYFVAAHWLQATYEPDPNFAFGPDVSGEKIRLVPPFARLEGSKFAVAKERYKLFDELADSEDNNGRSTIELYENNTRLGPAHSDRSDIANLGRGRFSHWRKNGTTMYWSSSDNTDPATNGRAYWVVKPSQSEKYHTSY